MIVPESVDVDPRVRPPLVDYRVAVAANPEDYSEVRARSVVDAAHEFYLWRLDKVNGEAVEQLTFVWLLDAEGEPISDEPDALRVTARRVMLFEARKV